MKLTNAIIDGVRTQKDGSLKITLITRELSAQEIAELLVSINKEIVQIDLPEAHNEEKSPATRLRNVFYRLWEQSHKATYDTFELYYRSEMERLINHLKEKLN